jgi:trehalose-phosphatase
MSPELLHRLEVIASAPVLLVACDYDGTLAPIVADPDRAVPHAGALRSLTEFPRIAHTHAAIISGRALSELRRFVGRSEGVVLVGSHGIEWVEGGVALSAEQAGLLRELGDRLETAARTMPGLTVERKPVSVALHYRNASDASAAEALASRLGEALGRREGVRTRLGSRVVEFLVSSGDKGAALRRVRHECGATGVVILGDDTTDEDAFRALEPGDLGIKVGDGDTSATVRVPGVEAVAEVLATLVALRTRWAEGRRLIPLDRCSVLSDQRTIAVVAPGAKIVWMCAPRLDSSALFAELIGGPEAGSFEVSPAEGGEPAEVAYAGDSFTLVTRWRDMSVTDYLDAAGGRAYQKAGRTDLNRVLEGRGEAVIRFRPRLDFGRVPTRLSIRPEGVMVEGTLEPLVLHGPEVSWRIVEEGGHHSAEGRVRLDGSAVVLEMRYGTANLKAALKSEAERRSANQLFWEGWTRTLRLPATARDLVRRSALVIKALCYGPTGAISAAATTSLPEHVGGVRNWDYRFCWPRDAAMAASALVGLGNTGHAVRFLDWMMGVVERCDTPDCLRPIYTVTGGHLPPEGELTHLPGYGGSRPVRVSNAAANQMQFDVYGPVVDLVARLAEVGVPVTREHWRVVRSMVEGVEAHWNEPDHGIWEMRTERLHHVHSKVMCWWTLDRALVVEEALLGRRSPEWARLRDRIRADVLEQGFHRGVGAFTGAYGMDYPDAAVLWIGLSGLLARDDPRWKATVEFVEGRLRRGPVVLRYLTDDGLPGPDCGYHICTGWLVESLLTVGRVDEARALFREFCGHARGTGILSEGYDPRHGLAVGNLAQVYSHLAIINAALAIEALGRSDP